MKVIWEEQDILPGGLYKNALSGEVFRINLAEGYYTRPRMYVVTNESTGTVHIKCTKRELVVVLNEGKYLPVSNS